MAIIKVPKTPSASFDKERRPSKLLLDQIAHLEWAALPAWQRKPRLMKKYQQRQVKTEQQAAERIAQLTAMVMQANAEDTAPPADGERPRVVLPPLPGTRKKAKRAAKTRKTTTSTKRAKTAKTAKRARGRR